MKKILLLLLIASLASGCGVALAQTTPATSAPANPQSMLTNSVYQDAITKKYYVWNGSVFGWRQLTDSIQVARIITELGGTTKYPLSFGYGLLGQPFTFNGSTAQTAAIDTNVFHTAYWFQHNFLPLAPLAGSAPNSVVTQVPAFQNGLYFGTNGSRLQNTLFLLGDTSGSSAYGIDNGNSSAIIQRYYNTTSGAQPFVNTFTRTTGSESFNWGQYGTSPYWMTLNANGLSLNGLITVTNSRGLSKFWDGTMSGFNIGGYQNGLGYGALYPLTHTSANADDYTIKGNGATTVVNATSDVFLAINGTNYADLNTLGFNVTGYLQQNTVTSSLLKADNTGKIVQAIAGTDYITPLTLANYAPIASPAFTGVPTAPTASTGNSTTQIATTAFVQNAASVTTTLSGLRSFTNPQSGVIYQIEDYGGGQWYWNSTDTRTDNTGTILQISGVTTGRFNRIYTGYVNVLWFGALPDCVLSGNNFVSSGTDNTTYIQNAVNFLIANNGGTLFFPNGNYLVQGTVYVNYSNNLQNPSITLKGETESVRNAIIGNYINGASFIRTVTGDFFRVGLNSSGNAVFPYPTNQQYFNFSANGLSFTGKYTTGGTSPVTGIRAFNMYATRAVIRNCSAQYIDYLVYQGITDASGNQNYCDQQIYENIYMHNSTYGGLYLAYSDGSVLNGIYCEDTEPQATFFNYVDIENSGPVHINGMVYWCNSYLFSRTPASNTSVIRIGNSASPTITNCHFEHLINVYSGIILSIVTNATVQGLLAKWTGNDIVKFSNVTGVDISGITANMTHNSGTYDFEFVNTNSLVNWHNNTWLSNPTALTPRSISIYGSTPSVTQNSDAIYTATDANYSVPYYNKTYILPAITASRTLTLPTALAGQTLTIINENTSSYTWSFASTVSGVTVIPNNTTVSISSDLTPNWVITTGQLQTGFSGGNSIFGDVASGGNLLLSSTANSTKGLIKLGANSAYNEASTLLGINTQTPTHSVSLGINNTGTANYYAGSGYDNGVTNYLRVRQYWNSNIFNIGQEAGGTGALTGIALAVGARSLSVNSTSIGNGYLEFAHGSPGTANINFFAITGGNTLSSGVSRELALLNTVNATGTAASEQFYAYPYYQSVGSGTQYLINLGTASAALGTGTLSQKFAVDYLGNVTAKSTMSAANYVSTSGTPTVVLGLSSTVGTGATISIAGTNTDGIVTVNTGTGITTTGALFTVTLNGFSYPHSCFAVVSAGNNAGNLSVGGLSTTGFAVVNASALISSFTYTFIYHSGGY